MEWVELGHVLAAAVWFGGTVYVEAIMANAKRTGDPMVIGAVGRRVGNTNFRLFAPAGVLTLAFGIWLVADSSLWEFSDVFITIGMTVSIIGIGLGIFFFKPRLDRLETILESDGPGHPDVAKIAGQQSMAGHAMSALLLFAMVAMVAGQSW